MAQSNIDNTIQSSQTKSTRINSPHSNSCGNLNEDELEGKVSTLIEPIECESDHSNLDLTDDEDDDDDDDDDSMNDKSNQNSETKDENEDDEYDDECDECLLDDYIQIDKDYKCHSVLLQF